MGEKVTRVRETGIRCDTGSYRAQARQRDSEEGTGANNDRGTSTEREKTVDVVATGESTRETSVSESGTSGRGFKEGVCTVGTRVGGRHYLTRLLRDAGCPIYVLDVGRKVRGGRD